jgi:glyoxylase-like metal-dependent hydrolase (beta-lactamase superfamily II)
MGGPEVLRILRVLAPNPGPFTLEGTNTWVVGRDPAVVIDPGPDDAGHVQAVIDQAGVVSAVLLTHDHPDHASAAGALSEAVGCPVFAYSSGDAREPLQDGQRIEAGGGHLEVVHTPGHSPDHVAFFVLGAGALFTGDAVLGRGTSVIDPPHGDLSLYLRSLRRMGQLRPVTIYPGHGPSVWDARGKLEEYLAHRARREEQLVDGLRSGSRTIADLVAEIYADQPAHLHPPAARTVLAHLIKLQREQRVSRVGSGEDARFALVEEHLCDRCGRPAMPRSRLCRRCSLDLLQESPERPPGGPKAG